MDVLQPIWLMTAAGPATDGPVLGRRLKWWNWKSHRPEWRLASDRSFAIDRPRVWNSLLVSIHTTTQHYLAGND